MGRLLYSTGVLTVIAGLLIIAGQCMAWMKLGVWTPMSVHVVLENFGVPDPEFKQSMLGLQKVIDWLLPILLDFPLSWVLFIAGALIISFADKNFPPVRPRKVPN
jgi:hypothetical protein